MSIHTNAMPETSKFREQSNLRPSDMTPPKKNNDTAELEISVPMLFVIIASIAILIYGGYSLFKNKNNGTNATKEPPTTLAAGMVDVTVSTEYVSIKPSAKESKYLFITLSDFECPYCKGFSIGFDGEKESSLVQITKRYIDSGIMKYGFAPFIAVPQHKPASTNETLGFYCALAQDKSKGFAFHDKVFEKTSGNGLGIDNKGAEKGSIIAIAKEVGLNESDFSSCYDKRDIVAIDKIEEKVEKEIKTPWGDKFGSQNFGTPAFAVCKISADNPTTCVGKAYVGAWPYADMKTVIDTFLGADAPKAN